VRHPKPDPIAPGQESVWDYPRPAIAEPTTSHLKVVFGGEVIAETRRGVRTLETSHPPGYYFPPDDVAEAFLKRNSRRTLCEWKGQAFYVDLAVEGRVCRDAGWGYASPTPGFTLLKDFITFYPGRVDACFVDGEEVIPQEGQFYGGWITSKVAGPFKGPPGTMGW
jgi:uncharacterized protein (DUF427 family)